MNQPEDQYGQVMVILLLNQKVKDIVTENSVEVP